MGSIPDGIYTAIGDVVVATAASPNAAQEIAAIISVLRHAQSGEVTAAEAAEAVRSASPASTGLIGLLASSKGMAVMTLIMLLVAIFTLVKDQIEAGQSLSADDVTSIIETTIRETEAQQEPDDGQQVKPAPQRSDRSKPRVSGDRPRDARKRRAQHAKQARRRNRPK